MACRLRALASGHLRAVASVLLAVGLGAGGCVQTAMLPARQLGPGTTAASATLDEPGFLLVPRANVQVTQGLGGGDLSANASLHPAEPLLVGGGLTGRYYVGPYVSAEAQVQALAPEASFEDLSGLALLGVHTMPASPPSWSLGAQVGALSARELDLEGVSDPSPPTRPRYTSAVLGGSVSYGPIRLGASTEWQIELEVNAPLARRAFERLPLPATRLSVGVFHLLD